MKIKVKEIGSIYYSDKYEIVILIKVSDEIKSHNVLGDLPVNFAAITEDFDGLCIDTEDLTQWFSKEELIKILILNEYELIGYL